MLLGPNLSGVQIMFIVIFTDCPTFPAGAGFVGPFAHERGARLWASKNVEEGGTYRIVGLVDIAEATL